MENMKGKFDVTASASSRKTLPSASCCHDNYNKFPSSRGDEIFLRGTTLLMADFGRGPSPRPGATRQLRQTHPQRVKKSSHRDSFQGRALGRSEARRLSFSALQVKEADSEGRATTTS